MVERVLVVGPKDTLSMVDDLAPKGFETIKALHNSPEMKAALPGTDYFVGFVQQYVTPQLYKDAPHLRLVQCLSAGYDRAALEALRPILEENNVVVVSDGIYRRLVYRDFKFTQIATLSAKMAELTLGEKERRPLTG